MAFVVSGALTDLTGYSARMQVRRNVSDTDPVISLDSAGHGITISLPATISIDVNATTTAAYSFDDGVYDFELVAGDGYVRRLLYGTCTLSKEVTRG